CARVTTEVRVCVQQTHFRARSAIRYPWTGPIRCEHPVRNVWGGPPDGNFQATIAASKLAFAPRGKLDVSSMIKRDLWEIGVKRESSGGKFATPPVRKLQTLGLAALLGVFAMSVVFLIRRRAR